MSQFAALDRILDTWRNAGYQRERLEVWAVGHPGSDRVVEHFAAGSEASCFVDSATPQSSAYEAFEARTDDLFVIDAAGTVRAKVNLAFNPLNEPSNQEQLDALVRGLL